MIGAAGNAALVMDYFTNPNFWVKLCNSGYSLCRQFQPSGVLTKAILLHSGAQMSIYNYGTTESNVNLGATPDIYQGFGRIDFANVLPLNGIYIFDLFVVDLMVIGENANIEFSVKVSSSARPLRATLAWYDPPNSGNPAKALLNNLDLSITSPTGKR